MSKLYRRPGSPYWWARVHGERVSTRLKVRAAAERWLAERLGDTAHRAADKTTLRTALRQHAEDRGAAGRAEGTLSMITVKARHLSRLFGADTPLSRITAAAVDSYRDTRRKEGAKAATIAKELSVLRGALRLARRRGEYHLDPAAVMPIGLSTASTPRTRYLTLEEGRSLLRALADAPGRAAHVAFILATGARWGESVRAHREDVGPRVDGYRAVRLRGTKTAKAARVVPVLGRVGGMLLRLALRYAPPDRAGRAMFAAWGNVRRDLAVACRRAGIAAVTPNDLRRSYATHLHQRGVPTLALSRMLGHADTRMVGRVYGQDTTESLANAVKRAGS